MKAVRTGKARFAYGVVGAVCIVALHMCGPTNLFGQIPPRMNYQGKLTDTGGEIVPDGDYEMLDEYKATRTIAVDRTRTIKFELLPEEDAQGKSNAKPTAK